jgi:chromosome segregation ATPase
VAKENSSEDRVSIDREIGHIRGCVDSIKTDITVIRKETENIFERIGELEKAGVSREERIIECTRRIDQICGEIKEEKQREYERQKTEKDQENARTNTKIAIVALVLTAAEIIFGIFVVVYHV